MKNKIITAVIACVVTFAVCVGVFLGVFAYWSAQPTSLWTVLSRAGTTPEKQTDIYAILSEYLGEKPGEGIDPYKTLMNYIDGCLDLYAIEDIDPESAKEYLMRGYLVGSVPDDAYADYYTPEEFEEFNASYNEATFEGFGIQMYNDVTLENGLYLYRVLQNSPAEKAGLRAGDSILTVNGTDLRPMLYDDAVEFVRSFVGNENGITLEVARGDETFSVSFRSAEFDEVDTEYTVTEDGIGFIRVHKFSVAADEQFCEALNEMNRRHVKAIIFDMRNNGGGLLAAVEDMLDWLLPKGEVIVTTVRKDGEDVELSLVDPLLHVPMAVLVNESTASAAELFASALRDVFGTPLVGARTYGKEVGQNTFSLPNGGAIKFTTFQYFTKARVDYNGKGLVPDVTVTLSDEETRAFYTLSLDEDEAFNTAKNLLLDSLKGN